jgi:two-component system, chemotaxis family, chemotaxis protein CheY
MIDLWSGSPPRGEDRAPVGTAQPRAGSDRQHDTVLVVDDDTSILDTVTSILTGEGYDVVSAATGEEALAAVARSQPLVILLDMRMPVMDGWAVARALRERGINVPIVVMTAAESAKRWADEVGAEGYLAKPFGLDDLLMAVERFRRPGGRAN